MTPVRSDPALQCAKTTIAGWSRNRVRNLTSRSGGGGWALLHGRSRNCMPKDSTAARSAGAPSSPWLNFTTMLTPRRASAANPAWVGWAPRYRRAFIRPKLDTPSIESFSSESANAHRNSDAPIARTAPIPMRPTQRTRRARGREAKRRVGGVSIVRKPGRDQEYHAVRSSPGVAQAIDLEAGSQAGDAGEIGKRQEERVLLVVDARMVVGRGRNARHEVVASLHDPLDALRHAAVDDERRSGKDDPRRQSARRNERIRGLVERALVDDEPRARDVERHVAIRGRREDSPSRDESSASSSSGRVPERGVRPGEVPEEGPRHHPDDRDDPVARRTDRVAVNVGGRTDKGRLVKGLSATRAHRGRSRADRAAGLTAAAIVPPPAGASAPDGPQLALAWAAGPIGGRLDLVSVPGRRDCTNRHATAGRYTSERWSGASFRHPGDR